MRRKVFALVLLAMLGTVALAQDAPSLNLSVTPTSVRKGQTARVELRAKNPRLNEIIRLQATATWEYGGQQFTAVSNEVQLTVDYGMPLRLEIPNRFRIVGTPQFDGQPIQAQTGNTSYAFDLEIPADGKEHLLRIDVTP